MLSKATLFDTWAVHVDGSTCPLDLSKFLHFIDMNFGPRQPYAALPLLPPATELETRPVLKACPAAASPGMAPSRKPLTRPAGRNRLRADFGKRLPIRASDMVAVNDPPTTR